MIHPIQFNKKDTPMRGSFEEEIQVINQRTEAESREKKDRANRIFKRRKRNLGCNTLFWQKLKKRLY